VTGSRRSDRGATAVEYALALGLFVLVVIGGLQLVQSNAEQELAADRASIAETEHFGTVGSTTSTPSTVPGPTTTAPTTTTESTTTTEPTTTTASTTPTTAPYGGVVTKSCSGDTCSFGLSPSASATWSISPSGSSVIQSGSPPGPVRFKKDGTFTVTANVAGTLKTTSVICVEVGSGPNKSLSCT
jgi:cytoskeletal protein RodZ